MSIRKTPSQIKKEILEFLFEGPKSVNELKEKLGSNWPTIYSYLEKLKKDGEVNEILITDKMKVYRRTDDPIFFSLPFNKDVRLKTLYILKQITRQWKENKKENELSKTALQKIAVEVIRKCNLNLPVLNFHYGLTTCASFNKDNIQILELIKEPSKNEKEAIDRGILEVIKDPHHTGVASEEALYQYNKDNMTFYKVKMKLVNLFYLDKKESKENIKKAIIELSTLFPIKLEKCYEEFNRFVSYATLILSGNNSEGLQKIRETFYQLWDKLTTVSFLDGSERFVDLKQKTLFEHMRDINLTYKEMGYKPYIEELESLAQEIDPFKINMPQNETSNEIQKLILEGLENE